MTYAPKPIDTQATILSADLLQLVEHLAKNTHENWAQQRIADGWKYGVKRNDDAKEHPSLIPYEELSETEKEYDRITSVEVLKAILVLGYKIEKA